VKLTSLLLFIVFLLAFLSLLNVVDVFRYLLDAFVETYRKQNLLVLQKREGILTRFTIV
jgi:hypothetical protein